MLFLFHDPDSAVKIVVLKIFKVNVIACSSHKKREKNYKKSLFFSGLNH